MYVHSKGLTRIVFLQIFIILSNMNEWGWDSEDESKWCVEKQMKLFITTCYWILWIIILFSYFFVFSFCGWIWIGMDIWTVWNWNPCGYFVSKFYKQKKYIGFIFLNFSWKICRVLNWQFVIMICWTLVFIYYLLLKIWGFGKRRGFSEEMGFDKIWQFLFD